MTPDGSLPSLGTTLAGKYRLERKLGQGGMGAVYEATHLRLGQRVAIKMVLPEVAKRPELAYRFDREARAAAALRGRHTARVFDVDTSPEGLPYLVMEYLEGHSLGDELKRRGPLPVDEAVRYLREACEGVDEAHRAGIIHRDLKPANLFLSTEEQGRIVKVVDFGIAKIRDAGNADHHTATGAAIGTYAFMSPEHARSPRSVDARSDVWSLGVVLYQLLSDELPFQGESVINLLYAIMAQAPPSLRAARADVPEALAALIERALCKEPEGRVQTVRELSDALAPFERASASRIASTSRAPTVDRPPAPPVRSPVERSDGAFLPTVLVDPSKEASSGGTTTATKSYAVPAPPAAPSAGASSRTRWIVGAVAALSASGVMVSLRVGSPSSGKADLVSGASVGQSSAPGAPVQPRALLADKADPAQPAPSAPVVDDRAMQGSERPPAPQEPTQPPLTAAAQGAKTHATASGVPAKVRAVPRASQGRAGAGKAASSAAPKPQEAAERTDVERF
jgi:eukaryotic-like serine/threonine-protein kinase